MRRGTIAFTIIIGLVFVGGAWADNNACSQLEHVWLGIQGLG